MKRAAIAAGIESLPLYSLAVCLSIKQSIKNISGGQRRGKYLLGPRFPHPRPIIPLCPVCFSAPMMTSNVFLTSSRGFRSNERWSALQQRKCQRAPTRLTKIAEDIWPMHCHDASFDYQPQRRQSQHGTYHAAEAHVYGFWSTLEPLPKLLLRVVFQAEIQEAVADDVYQRTPVCKSTYSASKFCNGFDHLNLDICPYNRNKMDTYEEHQWKHWRQILTNAIWSSYKMRLERIFNRDVT